MIVEIGHYALTLAFALALAQTVMPLWGTRRGATACLSSNGFTITARSMNLPSTLIGPAAIRTASTRAAGFWPVNPFPMRSVPA